MGTVKTVNEFEIKGLKTAQLVSNSTGKVILIGLEKGAILKEHVSNTDASIYVASGQVKFTILGKSYILKEGEIFTFLKDEKHELEGLENSKVLLIK